ncbi:MAG: hypothetical protein EP332_04265 [Bacteroidetes bacterium]|nr:MAG: hypothetical protein EP332_04265 [Bacteroidota bacterium]
MKTLTFVGAILLLSACASIQKPTQHDIELAHYFSWDTVNVVPQAEKLISANKTDTMLLVKYCANSCYCQPMNYMAFVKNGKIKLFDVSFSSKKKAIEKNHADIKHALTMFMLSYMDSCDGVATDYSIVAGSSGPSLSVYVSIAGNIRQFHPLYTTCKLKGEPSLDNWARSYAILMNQRLAKQYR